MIEKRTAEEILDKHIAIKLEAIPDIVPAMHEYAAQELAEYKTAIQELLPMAEALCQLMETTHVLKSSDGWPAKITEYEAIIERARKLIKL